VFLGLLASLSPVPREFHRYPNQVVFSWCGHLIYTTILFHQLSLRTGVNNQTFPFASSAESVGLFWLR